MPSSVHLLYFLPLTLVQTFERAMPTKMAVTALISHVTFALVETDARPTAQEWMPFTAQAAGMVHPQRVAVLPAGQVLEHPLASHPPCPLLPLEVSETSNLDISVAIQPHTLRLAPQHHWC